MDFVCAAKAARQAVTSYIVDSYTGGARDSSRSTTYTESKPSASARAARRTKFTDGIDLRRASAPALRFRPALPREPGRPDRAYPSLRGGRSVLSQPPVPP